MSLPPSGLIGRYHRESGAELCTCHAAMPSVWTISKRGRQVGRSQCPKRTLNGASFCAHTWQPHRQLARGAGGAAAEAAGGGSSARRRVVLGPQGRGAAGAEAMVRGPDVLPMRRRCRFGGGGSGFRCRGFAFLYITHQVRGPDLLPQQRGAAAVYLRPQLLHDDTPPRHGAALSAAARGSRRLRGNRAL